jgi:MFS family permease
MLTMNPERNPAAQTHAGTRLARPIHAYLLLLCGCMSVLAAVLIAPILPKMQAHFASVPRVEFLVPVALTAPGLVIAILSLFVGAIADRIGRKRLLAGGLLFYAAFGTAPMWLDSLYAILATRIGVGFTEAVIMTCCTALIGDYFEGVQRERYLALNTTFASTSAVIFIAIGGALGEFSWRMPFGVYAISLLLAPAVLLLLWEPLRRAESTGSAGKPAPSETGWHPGRLVGICAVTVVGAIAFMAVQVHIGYLLEGIGVTSSGTVGLVAAGAQVAVVVGSLLFRVALRAQLTTAIRLATAFGIVGLGFVTVGSAGSFGAVTAGAVITGLGGGILLPTLLCWNMCQLPPEHRALGTGAWMAAFFFGQFITPIVVVGISGQVGGLPQAVRLMGAVFLPCAIALLAAGFVRGRLRQPGLLVKPEHPARPLTGK